MRKGILLYCFRFCFKLRLIHLQYFINCRGKLFFFIQRYIQPMFWFCKLRHGVVLLISGMQPFNIASTMACPKFSFRERPHGGGDPPAGGRSYRALGTQSRPTALNPHPAGAGHARPAAKDSAAAGNTSLILRTCVLNRPATRKGRYPPA